MIPFKINHQIIFGISTTLPSDKNSRKNFLTSLDLKLSGVPKLHTSTPIFFEEL